MKPPTYLCRNNVPPSLAVSYLGFFDYLHMMEQDVSSMNVYARVCMYACLCGESDLIGLHPAAGLLYEIKLDEGESSALTWTPPSAMATEQQQHNNNAVRG